MSRYEPDPLSLDLGDNLIDQFYAMPVTHRLHSRWVMNSEWLNECCKISGIEPPADVTLPILILGRPVHVTVGGGFPHLIAK